MCNYFLVNNQGKETKLGTGYVIRKKHEHPDEGPERQWQRLTPNFIIVR